MISSSPPSLRARRTLRLIETLIGTTRISGIAMAAALLASLGWFSDSSLDVITGTFNGWETVLGIFSFPLIIVFLVHKARKTRSNVKIHVVSDENPPPVKVLLIILSPPSDNNSRHDRWEMPLVAIKHHLSRLERVVLIPSADRISINPKTYDTQYDIKGTYHNVDDFKERASTLISPEHTIEFHALGDLLPNHVKGVAFEDVSTLTSAIDDVVNLLKEQYKLPEYDILIDITGGQKIPTIAGAIVALSEGRRFQYVSTHDKKVMTFDVTYE